MDDKMLRDRDRAMSWALSEPQTPKKRLVIGLDELYNDYVENWDGEGEPACYDEFIDNEYDDMARLPRNERVKAYPYSENSKAFDFKWQAENLLEKIKEEGAKYGFKFVMDTNFLNDRQADFFYDKGDEITLMKSKFGTITMICQGELKGELCDKDGNVISEDIYDIRNILQTDYAFYDALIPSRLNLSDNNWFELSFYDKEKNFLCEFEMIEPVGGNITDGLEQLNNYLTDPIMDDIVRAMKGE